jgi:protein SCO1
MLARPRSALRTACCVLVLSGASGICACGGSAGGQASTASVSAESASGPGGFDGAELPGSEPAPDFTLRDQYGRSVSLSSFRGRPVILAFVYSTCGAVCAVIGQQIRGALNELSKPVAAVLVSAEPAADTPAAVRRYLASVSLTGRAEYLTGSPAQLQPVWRAYHVTPASKGRDAFVKYVSLMLIDGAGDERVLYSQEQITVEAIAHDVSRLEAG